MGGSRSNHSFRHVGNLGDAKFIVAMRGFGGPNGFMISYGRENRAAFRSNYRKICDSFKIVEQPAPSP